MAKKHLHHCHTHCTFVINSFFICGFLLILDTYLGLLTKPQYSWSLQFIVKGSHISCLLVTSNCRLVIRAYTTVFAIKFTTAAPESTTVELILSIYGSVFMSFCI